MNTTLSSIKHKCHVFYADTQAIDKVLTSTTAMAKHNFLEKGRNYIPACARVTKYNVQRQLEQLLS
jgi:hypothetical protein